MVGTVLAIIIPLAYFATVCAITRIIASRHFESTEDRVIAALVIGVFWPVAYPLAISVTAGRKAAEAKEAEIIASKYQDYNANTRGLDRR